MRLLASLSLAYYASVASANVIPANERCVTAIYTAYTYIAFSGEFEKGWQSHCQNPLEVTSIYASSDIFCQPAERSAGLAQLASICKSYGHVDLLPRESVAENLTGDAISSMKVVNYLEIPRKSLVDAPVLLSPSYYQSVFRTVDTWQFETWTHYAYGYAGYGYWAVVLTVGILHRVLQYLFFSLYERLPHYKISFLLAPIRNMYIWTQTHLLVPGPLPSQGRKFLWWTFSTRIEAIVILLFWLLSVAFCSFNYRLFPGNIYWPEPSTQLLRYIADRTGIISFANLPLIWLFAGRNNVCAWATGWNFATFNLFHRHVAWIATIQAVVHTALYLVLFFQRSNPMQKLQKSYLSWGALGTLLMLLLLPTAVNWFRRRAYETFLLIHIIFSVGLLVCCFYHTIIFEGHEYWFYLWLPVGIWGFDRLLRLIRLVYCNLHVRINAGSLVQYTTSTASYYKAADIVRLDVAPGSSRIRPNPGQYYFLYQPFRLTGWESHPFTLGCWSHQGRSALSPSPSWIAKDNEGVDVAQMPLLSDSSSDSGNRSTREPLPCTDSQELNLGFWIRPFDGWTRHLREQCMQSPDQTVDVRILLEGPYGHGFPLRSFDSVLFIAGGTGIASAVPYIHDHISRSSQNPDETATRVRDLRLVWVARQSAFIHQVATRELSSALGRDDFRASFYSTSPVTQSDSDTISEESTSFPAGAVTEKDIEISQGRPDIDDLILSHAREAQESSSLAAVLVCGPPAMADRTRAAVHMAMQQGYQSLQYIEESFSW
ncbi:hypothetical protein P175DRAFT_0503222 [Aspergillus ochraceoroseus IBT 24754]|uniref:FAD-binding FR-type domain-containing protein n=1 Tax=Aspergillus ochraceoroseus IBT 24754 TaxID=1392256 RepID=A0A2T5LTS0_9EURO|nr:uncharacterized protein P175DRAFT_0503222 [Aspergillus ochraceoroseus IBT 24754]PTU19680.1 hypothetical protein P175DRAFT_0503222 [Aspergillus ochraceoroseus IBT 24754]